VSETLKHALHVKLVMVKSNSAEVKRDGPGVGFQDDSKFEVGVQFGLMLMGSGLGLGNSAWLVMFLES
jgi:hypothetical protein